MEMLLNVGLVTKTSSFIRKKQIMTMSWWQIRGKCENSKNFVKLENEISKNFLKLEKEPKPLAGENIGSHVVPVALRKFQWVNDTY